ncbi:hypothetical protein [Phenylobacterium sp.]|uniref:DUF7662 domain-containing protein n=1 Tax=Phenylobacterium sp. TaxID=1871053 RepID=UPI0012075EC3|nr:hypothetical protein [Phenylobacterium sp.]THD62292.1 MAG: hypothetical protein E8A49_08505 [Phenylobacterium sp.]
MSKHNPLSARLAGHAGPEWRASFAELEALLGFPLPKAARTGKAWWKNDAASPHGRAWAQAGWAAEDIDHAQGLVTFRKAAPLTPMEPSPSAAPADEPAILTRLDATPKWSGALIAAGLVLAAGLSVFAVHGAMRKKA